MYLDNITELLNSGIEAKRRGDYLKALDFYNQVRKISPIDERVYGNSFKIYMGLEKYKDALKNILIASHLNILAKHFKNDFVAQMTYEQKLSSFEWNEKILSKGFFSKRTFDATLIHKALVSRPELEDLVYRAENLTAYAGHCVLGLDNSIMSTYKIPNNMFNNLNKKMLGQPSGEDLRQTPFYQLMLVLGFMVIDMNLDLSIKSPKDIVEHYMNTKFQIQFDVSKYSV